MAADLPTPVSDALHRLLRRLIFPAVAVLLGWGGGCRRKKEPPPPPPPQVEVHPVIHRDVPVYHEWIGTLDGFVNAEIRAQVTGYLIARYYQEGKPVRKGDLLFEIDRRPFQLALDEARATLTRSRAAQSKADLDEQRARQLYERDVISASEYDTQLEAALSARADTRTQEAAVLTAELNIGFTRIVAPIDGMAGIAAAQVGDLVGPSATTPLTTVSQLDPIKAYVTVSEQGYIQFTREYITMATRSEKEEALAMSLILADGSVLPYPGRFYSADLEVNPQTGALRFAGLFPNPEKALRPGLFCRVRAQVATHENALLVPQRAVSERQGKFQVATVGPDGKVVVQTVTPGLRVGQLWVISQGLKGDERVIVEGVQKARSGREVSARPWHPPPGYFDEPAEPVAQHRPEAMPTVPPRYFAAPDAPPIPPATLPADLPSNPKRRPLRTQTMTIPPEQRAGEADRRRPSRHLSDP
ncbi:MAG TPA: efflux RND transporter periplasmic adaptor subunit [Chthoniobacteraceae bacterium]|nr:efflux RND transporter periplasmic adaptor subunit [Chthoniobacteraceae bacterium]